MRRFFKKLKEGTEYLNYGRSIISNWAGEYAKSHPEADEIRIFDTGCGHGTDLINSRNAIHSVSPEKTVRLYGIENYEPYRIECEEYGIQTRAIDIERDSFPPDDSTMDIVITNQVLEHVKEIFWIFSEYARVLKPGGILIAGVPNLASLHNRLLLLFGRHPTAQQSLSAHVRTFTKPDLKHFAETGGFFKMTKTAGSNFYPFPPFISKPLAFLFPGMAWGLFAVLQRTDKTGSFLECLSGDENFLETPFYGSPQNPPKPAAKAKKAVQKKPAKKKKHATGRKK